MSKADFIHPEWLGILDRASRAAGGFASLEAQFLQLRSDLMAKYETLKAEVDETVASVKSVIGKLGEVSSELTAAKLALENGQDIDYSDLVAKLDEAQASMAEAIKPAEKLPEEVVLDPAPVVVEAPAPEIPPADPAS
jgi:DNA repair ATPase RecN